MGHGIFYCTSCQTQLRDPDFDKGAAYRLEGQAYCEKCARNLIATLPEDRLNDILRAFESTHDEPPERPAPSGEKRGNRTTRIMKALAATPGSRILTSTSRRMATVPSEKKSSVPLVAGIGVAVVILIVLAIFGMSDNPSSSPQPAAARPVAPPVVIPEAAPEDRPAKMIAAAREYARRNPDDLQKQVALFEEVGIEPGAARYSEEVGATLRELRRKLAERRTLAIAPVGQEMRALAGRQEFKAAAARIAEARSRQKDPEWDRALDQLSEELEKEIGRAFVLLRNQAADAHRRGAAEDVRRIQERVAGWSRPDLARELETALARPEPPTPVPQPPPPPPPAATSEAELREAGANELFQAAETLYRSAATRGEALAKFCALQSEFGTTRLVAGKRAVIQERLEAAKDHLLLAVDLRPTGAWRFSGWKKAAAAWTADADLPASARPQNALDASFAALPGVEYAAWVYAGACCAEAFVFHVQGSELPFLDPKTREKSVAEIGSGLFVTLKPATSLLKTHATHGSRRDPVVWQWVPLTLPKYATAGEKRLRFFGETQGFSVAWVAVSATRKAHPADSELRDLEKQRPDSAADATETRLRQGLVAHWKMDEGSGPTVVDATGRGNAGAIKGGVGWTPGVIGKALKFDGDAGYVDCGANDALNLRKTLTLTAWVKCTVEPAQYDGIVMKSNKDWLAGYGFWFEPKSILAFFVADCSKGCAIADISYLTWNHIAGTYDGKRVRIFVNGKEGTGKDRTGEIPPCPEPLWIGRASTPNAGQFTLNGEIDDVRLYDRALDESEIRALSAVRR